MSEVYETTGIPKTVTLDATLFGKLENIVNGQIDVLLQNIDRCAFYLKSIPSLGYYEGNPWYIVRDKYNSHISNKTIKTLYFRLFGAG